MRENSILKSRILQYLEKKGITKYECYAKTGITNGVLSQSNGISEDNILKFLSYYKDISLNWLFSGDGLMLLEDEKIIFNTKTPRSATHINGDLNGGEVGGKRKLQKTPPIEPSESASDDSPGVQYKLTTRGYGFAAEPRAEYKTARDFSLRTDRPIDMQRVPLYDLNASAGLVGLFIDSSHQAPVDYISIPGLPRCDGAVHVCGDSMYPLLKSGDIVIYKEVNDIINNIFWGEMYMVSFDVDGEEYIAIKYVQRSDDPQYIRLVSYNTHHSPQDIKLSRVRALAIIKASVRFNTMG